MLKRLINSSVSAMLGRSAQTRGAQRWWISTSVPPSSGAASSSESQAGDSGPSPLVSARQDCVEALADIRTQQAGDLVKRVGRARSMRELWYLRTEFFYLIAQHRDQAEAKVRLDLIDGHFPKRQARRSSRAFGETQS